MDEKDLKIQALLEEVARLTNLNADLRVQLTMVSRQAEDQRPSEDQD